MRVCPSRPEHDALQHDALRRRRSFGATFARLSVAAIVLAAFASIVFRAFAGDAAAPATGPATRRSQPFILGADISWIPEDEAAGATYYDHGVRKDIVRILSDHGFNWVRLRTFVNPKAPHGYAAGQPEAFCDLPHTIAMARRARAAHMKVLLDLHLSDTWASPGHQNKPAAWAGLAFPDLLRAVHDYARDAVAAMKEQGVEPDMVQVGNEITDGLLFPDGSMRNWDDFAALLRSGIAGIREVDPAIPIMLHHHMGRNNAVMRVWLDNLIGRGVVFEVIGMSCYAQAHPGDWKANFDDLAVRYPDKLLVIAEYSGHKEELNDLIYNAPGGRGLGSFIWEPTRWLEALFDQDGVNAGGGAKSNDLGQAQGATPTTRPAAAGPPTPSTHLAAAGPPTPPSTRPAASPGPLRRRHGGRYDANPFLDLYPAMAKKYEN